MTKKTGIMKASNMETSTYLKDKALPEAIINDNSTEIIEVKDQDIQDATVYENGITSIDIMMPEKEREILENNLNVYSDIDKTNKILKKATSNMKIRQGIKELEQIDKLGDIIDSGQLKLNDMLKSIDMNAYMKLQKEDPEAASKAIKNVAVAVSSMIQVRDAKVKSLNGSTSNKKMKIGIIFKNDNGEETSLGVEMQVLIWTNILI